MTHSSKYDGNREYGGTPDGWRAEQLGDAYEGPMPSQPPTPELADQPSGGYRYRPIDSAAFAAADYRPTWLVQRLLVCDQPCIVGGPKKALKTSLLVDLAVSLGTGSPFLGEFTVTRPVRVAVLSGESGEHTLQETALRICRAKGVGLASVDCLWSFHLPQLANVADLGELTEGLRKGGVQVAIIDPLYLCLLAGRGAEGAQASNLFDMGPLLLGAAKACLVAGATPILAHHARKNLTNPLAPPELEDLAFAGVQEFARQWILVNRREKYEPGTGQHKLWLTAGGSVGHGGLWAVDVDEGQLDERFTGRKWDVTVNSAAAAREELLEQGDLEKERKAQRKDKADDAKVLGAIDRLTERLSGRIGRTDPQNVRARRWPTLTDVRTESHLSSDRTKRAIQRLLDEQVIEEATAEIATGKNGKVRKAVPVLRRRQATERTERTVGLFPPQSAHSTELSGQAL